MPATSAIDVGVIVSMPSNFADCKARVKTVRCSLSEDCKGRGAHDAQMADDKNGGPNHLRAWREFMKLTQEELAAACEPPTTGSVISLLEEGERGLSLKWLRRLAPALKTRPGFIADYDPRDADTRLLELIANIPQEDKEQVEEIIRTFTAKAA